jgi:2-polyprenyl-6-hydroxyphenyl methylase/3-demethylubiquinone-9 3-methyltransferase
MASEHRSLIPDYGYHDESSATSSGHHGILLGPVERRLRAGGARVVLDVGCGDGAFARSLGARGFEVYGCDASASGIAIASKRDPARFSIGSAYDDLTKLFEGRPHFDAIVAVEVIEHLYAPREFLQRVRQALAPGGLLVLTTPYHGYLKNLAIALSGRMDAHFSALWDGGHIKFWSRKTLSHLLREQGFSKIVFEGAGRLPLLWRAMVMSGRSMTAT